MIKFTNLSSKGVLIVILGLMFFDITVFAHTSTTPDDTEISLDNECGIGESACNNASLPARTTRVQVLDIIDRMHGSAYTDTSFQVECDSALTLDTGWVLTADGLSYLNDVTSTHDCINITGVGTRTLYHDSLLDEDAICPLYHRPDFDLSCSPHNNQQPLISIAPIALRISEGEAVNSQVSASDADAYPNPLSYILNGAPSWLRIGATGLITGTLATVTGSSELFAGIELVVSDGDLSASRFFSIEVISLEISGTPTTRVNVNENYSFTPSLIKPTNSVVTFSVENTIPPGLTFNTVDGSLTGIATTAGNYPNIIISAIDSTRNNTDSLPPFMIVVNGPPTVNAGGPYSVEVNLPLTFNGQASDPNGDPLDYLWDFGDGGSSTELTPTYIYTTEGDYLVSLTVTERGFTTSVTAETTVKVSLIDVGLNAGLGSESIVCNASDPLGTNGSNPINGATGNKIETETDYVGSGVFPLVFVRYYSSESSINADLGQHWRHSYLRSIELDTSVTPNIARVKRADGTIVKFEQSGTTWKPRAGIRSRLESDANEWRFYTSSDDIETYAISTGTPEASISKIANREGFTQTFAYVGGKLDTITDNFGRKLSFAYNLDGQIEIITDPALKTIQFSYLNGNLESVTYQDLTTRRYEYNDPAFPNNLTGIIDQNGSAYANWSYDSQGRAISSKHAGNTNYVGLVYNGDDTTTFTDALGTSRTYTYIAINGALKVKDIAGPACNVCGGGSKNNTYDANGFLDIVTDFKGNITDYNFNDRGLIEQRIEAKGTTEERTTQTVWDTKYNLPTCVIAPRNTTYNIYTSDGKIESRTVYDTTDVALFPSAASKTCTSISARADITSLNTSKISYSYFTNGLLEAVDGPLTDVQDITKYAYDTLGNVRTITNALQQVTTLQNYDTHGRPQTIIDANGLITTIVYDLLGRKDIVTVGSEITDFDYFPNGNLDKVTLPDGSYLDYRYDDAQRLTDIYDQLGNHTNYTLNALGSRTKTDTSDPAGALKRTQSATYDLENRLEKIVGAANQETNYMAYDGNGNLEQVQDPELNNSSFTYDALERLKTSTDAKLGITTNSYDAQNNLTSITDPRGLITTYSYDGLGNRIQVNSPETGVTDYTSFDATGNVLSSINALGKTMVYQYDVLGRLKLITYQDGTTTEYTYDVGINSVGRLSSITYNGGITSFAGIIIDSWTYDKYGRVLSKTQSNEGVMLTTRYTYNAVTGNLETETTPAGQVITYKYLRGQVISISVGTQNVMSDISYDPFGPPTKWIFGNGSTVSRVYNKDGQLESYPNAGITLTNSYFPVGSLQHIVKTGTVLPHASYTYDALQRVITSDVNTNTEAYDYDANNNRILQTIDLLSFNSTISTISNQLNSRTGPPAVKSYIYDLAGNTIDDSDHTYGYDDRGRLTSLDSDVIKYAINGLGQRTRKHGSFNRSGDLNGDGTVNFRDSILLGKVVAGLEPATELHDRNNDGVVGPLDVALFKKMLFKGHDFAVINFDIRFVYNSQGQLEGEYDTTGKVIQEYIWFAGQPVAVLQRGKVYYIDVDHLGTPKSISDQSQNVVWTWETDPYGRATPNVDVDGNRRLLVVNLRFPGQYYDHESGLHYNINRFYDPSTGRYLESDPIGLAGGLNTYGYVGGNSVNLSDMLGLYSTGGHDYLIDGFVDKYFPGASNNFKKGLNAGSNNADSIIRGNQSDANSFIHAMTSAENPNVEDMCNKMNRFINDEMGTYRFYRDAFNEYSSKSGNKKAYQAYEYKAAFALGRALHPVMDSTSPAHRGGKYWSTSDMFDHGPWPWSLENKKVLQNNSGLYNETLNRMGSILNR